MGSVVECCTANGQVIRVFMCAGVMDIVRGRILQAQ